jgi:hypothetical protein
MGGRIMLTAGVNALSDATKAALITKVRAFDGFGSRNDTIGEHKFINIEHEGIQYFGVIDYFAPDLCHVSNDPSDTTRTARVLTIMRADEC